MKAKLARLENKDIYWLLATYIFIPLFGPFAALAIFIAWVWAILRHRDRQELLEEIIRDVELEDKFEKKDELAEPVK